MALEAEAHFPAALEDAGVQQGQPLETVYHKYSLLQKAVGHVRHLALLQEAFSIMNTTKGIIPFPALCSKAPNTRQIMEKNMSLSQQSFYFAEVETDVTPGINALALINRTKASPVPISYATRGHCGAASTTKSIYEHSPEET